MAGTNDFLPFATAGGANVLSQSAYAALAAVATGYQAGVAQSAQLNKTWRQSSIIAAMVAQFIVDQTGANAVDDGTIATLEANFIAALRYAGVAVGTDTGAANACVVNYTPAIPSLVDGMVLWFKAATANTGATTLNVNGLGAKAVVGGAHAALQGGEIIANGKCMVVYNATLNSFVLIECTGAALQVAAGTQSSHAANVSQLGPRNLTPLTASGSYTVPANIYLLDVEGWAGGGGGGGTGSTGNGGAGGGGAGGYFRALVAVTPGQVISYTIGAAGTAGGAGGSGGTGGTTTFGALSATGGTGGGPNVSTGGNGGAGGTSSGGTLNYPGGDGSAGGPNSAAGGVGGTTSGGGGAGGGAGTGSSSAGKIPGGGGAGNGGVGAAGTGAAGARGQINIRY